MAGRYPKPDGQKVNRGAVLPWTTLTARREGDPPALPDWREWHPQTLIWWAGLWRTHQATQWQQSGTTLHGLACLYDDLIAGRATAAKVSAEIRAHEMNHGISPKGLLGLRWRIGEPEEPEPTQRRKNPQRLRVISNLNGDAS
jgi:hypothetical protein